MLIRLTELVMDFNMPYRRPYGYRPRRMNAPRRRTGAFYSPYRREIGNRPTRNRSYASRNRAYGARRMTRRFVVGGTRW